jgi:hypothetical protein
MPRSSTSAMIRRGTMNVACPPADLPRPRRNAAAMTTNTDMRSPRASIIGKMIASADLDMQMKIMMTATAIIAAVVAIGMISMLIFI